MPDARCTRDLVCKIVESAHTSIQGSGGNPTFPAQWLYGLFRALPGDRLVATVISGTYRRLDACIGASGPHDFTVRFDAGRQGTSTSTATRPSFVTTADAPLSGTGWR